MRETWIVVFCIVLPNQASFADPPAPGAAAPAFTLADLENIALANNPTIAAAEALVQQQLGLLRQAGLYPNPTVGYLRDDPNQAGQSETQGVFLSQDIVTASKIRLARAALELEVEMRESQVRAQRERVKNDVRIRYYEVLGAAAAEQAAEELEKLAVSAVQAMEELLKAKQGTRPDLLQAEMQLIAVRTSLRDAQYRRQAAWRQLSNVIGAPQMAMAPLSGRLEDNLPRLDWEESLSKLLAENPVLHAQDAEVRASRADYRLARAQAVPNLNIQLVVQHDQVQKFDSVSTLVSLPIPIFNRNQGNIASAAAAIQQQEKEYERAQLALRDQLAAAFQQYQSARNQADRLRLDVLPRAKENLDLTLKAYQAGQFDFQHVLNARQLYFTTKLASIDALTAMHKAAVEIEGLELIGGLNPTEVGTALQAQGGGGSGGARTVLLQQLQEQSGGGNRLLPGAVQGAAK